MQTPVAVGCPDLTPCLLKAIEDHKYLSSCARRREVGFLEAARDFLEHHEPSWRTAKVRADNAQQVQEMRRHLWIESEKAGHDLGRNAAGTDWVSRFACAWRLNRESLRANGFREASVRVGGKRGRTSQDLQSTLDATSGLDADVFVSQPTLSEPHFRLQTEPGTQRVPYLVFGRAALPELGQLSLAEGALLTFIAYGKEAERTLAVIQAALG